MSAIILDSLAERNNDFAGKTGFRVVSKSGGDYGDDIEYLSGQIRRNRNDIDDLSGIIDEGRVWVQNLYDETNIIIDNINDHVNRLDNYLQTVTPRFTAFEVTATASRNTHSFYIRTSSTQGRNRCFVDWGDGTRTNLSSTTDVSEDSYYRSTKNKTDADLSGAYIDSTETLNKMNEYNVSMVHQYENPGKYIVTIYGDDYWGLMSQKIAGQNIISRVFDEDLPLNPCVRNLATWCISADMITSVYIPNYYDTTNVINWTGCFQNCTGLTSFYAGDKNKLFTRVMYACAQFFSGCTNLKNTNVDLPVLITNQNYTEFYNGCSKLEENISTLIPASGLQCMCPNLTNAFKGCTKLTGNCSTVKHLLWESPTYSAKWTTTGCFTNSGVKSTAIQKFGGTLANPDSASGSVGTALNGVTLSDESVGNFEDLAKVVKKIVEKFGGTLTLDI